MRTIAATRCVTPLREGGSLPAVVEADDDGMYVMKSRGAGRDANPRTDLDAVYAHPDAIVRLARGGAEAGPTGARARWLTAQRSSIIQASTEHADRAHSAHAIVEHLLSRMVRLSDR